MTPFDDRICALGEGPLWHPLREQFFWFDILGQRLLTRAADGVRDWRFDTIASAAAWVDRDRLLIGTEVGLVLLDMRTDEVVPVAAIEADDAGTRSNDGRADPQGGFWLGTMGKAAEPGRGAIWRFHRGHLRRLVDGITIPNAICFAADGRTAFYADTACARIWAQPLDGDGWPKGDRRIFADLAAAGLSPDGAVIDTAGDMWVACWGAGRVVRLGANGQPGDWIAVGGRNSSCPAFGGTDMRDMLVTTATQGLDRPAPGDGLPYLVRAPVAGRAEPAVIL